MYNLNQTAQMLRVPAGTLRKYIQEYSEFLSSSARESGTNRSLTKDDLVVLGRIRKYKTEQVKSEEIRQLLKKPAGTFGGLFDRIQFPDKRR